MKFQKSGLKPLIIFLILSLALPSNLILVSAKTNYTLQGWRTDQDKWIGGNLFTYYEDEWVPYRLEVRGYDGQDLTICVDHDYFDGTTIGVDETRNWFIGASVNTSTPPENINPLFLPGTVFNITGPTYLNQSSGDIIEYCFHITNTSILIALSDFTFYWEAHLAIGSSEWNGASLHARTSVTGNQDVPIKIPPSPGASDVDIVLDKTGPVNASIGEEITYIFNVSNLEPNIAYNITVEDNKCGIASYVSGDTNGNDGLDAGEYWIFECNYTVNTSDPDPLVNLATVSTMNNDLNNTNNDDSWSVDILRTGVYLSKTGPAYAHSGDEVNYTYRLENTGETTLNLTSMNDNILGDLSGNLTDTLTPGRIIEFNVSYFIDIDTENQVVLQAENLFGDDPQEVNDSHLVDVLNPGISVNKTADKQIAHELDNVTYYFNITNSGDTPLYNVSVYDSILGLVFAGNLEAGEQRTIVFQIPIGAPDPLINNVTARGQDALGLEVNNTDSWIVDVLHPSINIIKTGNTTAVYPPESVNYTIFVENIGDTTLYNVTVNDPKLGVIQNNLGTLISGENRTIYEDYLVTGSDSDPFQNFVNVTGVDELGLRVNDTSNWLVDLLNPNINVTKTANTSIAHAGDTVEYNITVTNTGDTVLNITVDDPLIGYTDSYNDLLGGSTVTFLHKYTIQPSDPDPFTNIVNMTAKNDLLTIQDNASWTVDIINPSISVNKTATHPVVCSIYCNGTYIIAVTNTGDTPLYNLSLVDDMWGQPLNLPDALHPSETFSWQFDKELVGDTLNNVTAAGEDILNWTVTSKDSAFIDFINPSINLTKTSNNTLVHPGDPVQYNFTVLNNGDDPLRNITVTDNVYGQITVNRSLNPGENFTETIVRYPTENTTNIATAKGINSLNNTNQDQDNHTVGVLEPRIDVYKTGPIRAPEGETVTYNVTVKNTGNTKLYLVNITDSILGDLLIESELEPGETATLTPQYKIPSPSDTVINIVNATGVDLLGLEVSNSSSWSITVPHPDIEIIKTGPSTAYQGEKITYNIIVINTGDTGLFNVKITDPKLGLEHTIVGPFTGNTTLQIEYMVPYTDADQLTNTVNVTGVCCVGTLVSDTDDHTLKILKPVGGVLIESNSLMTIIYMAVIITIITKTILNKPNQIN